MVAWLPWIVALCGLLTFCWVRQVADYVLTAALLQGVCGIGLANGSCGICVVSRVGP